MNVIHFLVAGAIAVGGCTALHEPLEEAKPIESIRLMGDFAQVGHCVENALRQRDPVGHYAFEPKNAEGVLDGNDEWEIVFRQETPTSLRAAIKSELTNVGTPKRPAGLTLLLATCAGDS
jgi:hypothetical protein